MDKIDFDLSRRNLFLSGALGVIAVAAAAHDAQAAEAFTGSSSVEKANIQLVKDFCDSWGDDPPDVQKMAGQFLTDDCLIRFGDTVQPVTGSDAAMALFQTFFNNGERYELKIVETFARGPLVVNSRMDSTIKEKRKTNSTPVIGVFYIKDGKIKEWSDYV
jgi:limonene-1,2-epoxide hydrolase